MNKHLEAERLRLMVELREWQLEYSQIDKLLANFEFDFEDIPSNDVRLSELATKLDLLKSRMDAIEVKIAKNSLARHNQIGPVSLM